jgi:transposase
MAQVRSWAGLDVHAATVVAATMDRQSGELVVRRLPGETGAVVAFCAGLPGPTQVAYEAGPTGFGIARALEAAGVGCLVAAPGKSSGRRVIASRPTGATPSVCCGC